MRIPRRMGMIGGPRGAATPVVIADFSAATLGVASIPAGTTFTRSSTCRLMTSANTMFASSLTANQAGVGQYAGSGTRGLKIEKGTINRGPTRLWHVGADAPWAWPQEVGGGAAIRKEAGR